ncbi:MAG TPA: hypothetical protein VFP34_13660, partial [Microlunatus sp.]|nr:hypothetical protein [Microlunatus sp.]
HPMMAPSLPADRQHLPARTGQESWPPAGTIMATGSMAADGQISMSLDTALGNSTDQTHPKHHSAASRKVQNPVAAS